MKVHKKISATAVAAIISFLIALPITTEARPRVYLKNINKSFDIDNLRYDRSFVAHGPWAMNTLNETHSLGRKLSELAYFARVTNFGNENNSTVRDNKRNLNFRDTAAFIAQQGFLRSDCRSQLHNNLTKKGRRGDYNNNRRPWAPLTNQNDVIGDNTLSLTVGINRAGTITPYEHVLRLWNDTSDGGFKNILKHYNCFGGGLNTLKKGRTYNGKKQSTLSMCSESQYNREFNREFIPTSNCYDVNRLGKGPFRLLAVVNRMDNTANNLTSGVGNIKYAGASPRALGELHLIYGLVDPEYERTTGQPYPMTFRLSYRLPQLTEDYRPLNDLNAQGVTRPEISDLMGQESLAHRELLLPENKTEWDVQANRWARLWVQMSRMPYRKDSDYARSRNHLDYILSIVARPENFLNVMTNTLINGKYSTQNRRIVDLTGGSINEFKNYYFNHDDAAFNDNRVLDDVYRCAVNTTTLRAFINGYWVYNSRLKRSDLLMLGAYRNGKFYPDDYVSSSVRDPRAGYGIDVWGTKSDSYPPFFNDRINIYNRSMPGCSNSIDNENPSKFFEKKTFLRPNFTRTNRNFYWKFADKGGLPSVSEPQTHGFAMRSCSGCHGGETATNGFHIGNRMKDNKSAFSKYLMTNDSRGGRTSRRTQYSFSIPEKRIEWLHKLAFSIDEIQPADIWYRTDQRIR